MNRGLAIRTVVAIGIGAAVYVILGRFAAIPTPVPNTSIHTTFAFLALMSVIFGPLAGGLIGLIGHALLDAISYGSIWWSWVVISGFVGLFIGYGAKKFNIDIESGVFGKKEIISFNLIQIVVQLVGWGLLAPTLDILIYVEPNLKVFVQGITAAGSNIVTVGVIGTLLLVAYAKTRSQSDSLTKE